MALYLGGKRVKLSLGGTKCRLNLVFIPPTINGVLLVSSDGFALQDSTGSYLTVKERE